MGELMSHYAYCNHKRAHALETVLATLEHKSLKPTWANIGRELGITRQAAQARFKDMHTSAQPGRNLANVLEGVDTSALTVEDIHQTYAPHLPIENVRSMLGHHDLAYAYVPRKIDSFLEAIKGVDTSEMTAHELMTNYKPEGMADRFFLSYIHSQSFRAAHGIQFKRLRAVKSYVPAAAAQFLEAIKGKDISNMTARQVAIAYCPTGTSLSTVIGHLCNAEFRNFNNINIKTRRTK